jgi:hypothetical protein
MTWVQRVIVYFISVLLFTASVRAEEVLEKDSGRFLGWQMNATDFTDCDNNKIKIPPGKVTKTSQKCRGIVFSLKDSDFRVETVDLGKRTFSAVNLNTKSKVDFFYPEVAESPGEMKLDLIKPGQRVGINYYDAKSEIWGPIKRVEAIKVIP